MIKSSSKAAGIFGLATLMGAAMALAVFAETPSTPPSFALPPIPGAPKPPSAPAAPSAPSATATPSAATNTSTTSTSSAPAEITPPVAANESADRPATKNNTKPSPTTTETATNSTGESTPPLGALPAISAPALGTSEQTPPAASVATTTTPPALPTLDLQAPLPALDPTKTSEAAPVIPQATPLPIAVKPAEPIKKKEPEKTWLTKLEPTVVIPKLGYHYRREILPGEIYRNHYNVNNRHLPTLITREDYERLFLVSVARNDINATRAFLNEGIPVNTTNANGESALSLAQRYHATDTARLLIARGAY